MLDTVATAFVISVPALIVLVILVTVILELRHESRQKKRERSVLPPGYKVKILYPNNYPWEAIEVTAPDGETVFNEQTYLKSRQLTAKRAIEYGWWHKDVVGGLIAKNMEA